ncbi:MAG: 2-C-methyl-D-erythritol 4-phosphate cytidylyltransferase [bacterium]
MKTTVLIPAAGRGKRMKEKGGEASLSKQFLLVQGLPVIVHALKVFQRSPMIDDIVLIISREEFDYCRKEIVEPCGLDKCRRLVEGGSQRQDSVFNGLEALSENPPDLVVVHDAARPLVTDRLIEEVVRSAAETGAALAAVPAKDTVKQVSREGLVESTLDRGSIWQAQTPQAFSYEDLWPAARAAKAEGLAVTDEAALLEAMGKPVTVVPGDYRNLKITTPEDLQVADLFLGKP